MSRALICLLSAACASLGARPSLLFARPFRRRSSSPLLATAITRRELAAAGLGTAAVALAADARTDGMVVVIGAGGRTGLEVVKYCAKLGMSVRACTRGGDFDAVESAQVNPFVADVSKPTTLAPAVAGARVVVFVATASAFGSPAAVDHIGLASTARACIAASVPRLVVVSGAGVTKVESPAYRVLNLFGRRMDEKLAGEAAVRALYASAPSGVEYTIVRPSGLGTGPAKGAGALEINQGDEVAGSMSRADVAAVCVECALSEAASRTTFECYETGTALATSSLSLSGILSDQRASNLARFATLERDAAPVPITGFERRAGDYASLFSQLKRDA